MYRTMGTQLVPHIKLLASVLLLSITILQTEQVKVAIKYNVGDWCIRVKDSRVAIVEECYWKGNISTRKIQEKEQTFDVHPEDIDEQPAKEAKETNSKQPYLLTQFLIRVSKNQPSSSSSRPVAATQCLASISTNLTVERCQLRKSRFRISGSSFAKLHSNSCPTETLQPLNNHNVSYKIYSSDQSCLEFITRNETGGRPKHFLAFTKCSPTADKLKQQHKKTHLWQFCGQNGNCTLSPLDLNWDTLIKIDYQEEINHTICETTTTPTTTTTSTTTSSPLFNDAVTVASTEYPIINNPGDFMFNTTTTNTAGDRMLTYLPLGTILYASIMLSVIQ